MDSMNQNNATCSTPTIERNIALGTDNKSDTFRIVIVGGGSDGQIMAITLAEYLHKLNRRACIWIYEPKWIRSEEGSVKYGEGERSSQVATLQDKDAEKLSQDVLDALFGDEKACERVWPTSRNIPIQELEDRLLVVLNKWESGYVKLNLETKKFDEQELEKIEGSLDVLVGADGPCGFVREHFTFDNKTIGVEYAIEVEFDLEGFALTQAENVSLNIFQVRYSVNSLFATGGLLNIRLSKEEYDVFTKFKSSQADFDNLFNREGCVERLKDSGLLWLHTVVQDGLHLFNIPEERVKSINPIQTNIDHTTEWWEFGGSENSQYCVCIIGDTPSRIDFWPIKRLSSGIKTSIALSRVLAKGSSLNAEDFKRFTEFMNVLTQSEHQEINIDDCVQNVIKEQEIDIIKLLGHDTDTIPYTTNTLRTKLVTNTQELDLHNQTKSSLSSNFSAQLGSFSVYTIWPPKALNIFKDMFEKALGKIQSELTLRILEKCGPWPIDYITDGGIDIDDFGILDPTLQQTLKPQAYTSSRSKIAPIPGLYLLIELIKESTTAGLVDKPIFRYDDIEMLCNDLAPGMYHSKSDIDFNGLNRHEGMRLVGCYGKKNLIIRWLKNVDVIDENAYNAILSETQSNENNRSDSYFRPGVYFLRANNREDLGIIFFWPDDTSFEKDASPNTVKNTENCIRYLTQLTQEQVCLMSPMDIKSLQSEQSKQVAKQSREAFAFKVKETQDAEDEIFFDDGFNLSLPKPSHNLKIMIVENDSMPYIATLQTTAPTEMKTISSCINFKRFDKLHIFLRRDISQMKLFIDESVNPDGLLFLMDALDITHEQKDRVLSGLSNAINETRVTRMKSAFWQMVSSEVKNIYRELESMDNSFDDLSTEIKELSKHEYITKTIEAIKDVTSSKWKRARKRFELAKKICSINHDIKPMDILHFGAYNTDDKEVINHFINGSQEELDSMNMTDITDDILLKELFSSNQKELQKFFSNLYQEWKSELFDSLKISDYFPSLHFPEDENPWATDLKLKFKDDIRNALINEFNSSKNKETLRVKKIMIRRGYLTSGYIYKVSYTINSISPPKTDVTLYETNLTPDDKGKLKIRGAESPLITPSPPNKSGMFSFDPEKRNLRKIIRMPNKQCIAFFWNLVDKQTEMYIRTISHTSEFSAAIENGNYEMRSNDDYTMFAWDHHRGLLACYSPERVRIRQFDSSFHYQPHFYLPDFAPEQIFKRQVSLAHFFWIPGKTELCMIEFDGQMSIYDIETQHFSQRGLYSLPNTDFDTILGSPDGDCIIGFSKIKQIQNDSNHDATIPESTNLQAHVRFYENLSCPPIVVDLPTIVDFRKQRNCFFRIALDGKQFQIIYIDHERYSLRSYLVRLKTAKSSFCIQPMDSTIRQTARSTFGTNAIDYLGRVFIRFPVLSAIQQSVENENGVQESIQSLETTLSVVIDTTLDEIKRENYDKKVPLYIKNMWKKLGTKTSKPVGRLNNNSAVILSIKERKIMDGSIYRIGDWMIRLISLLPIQIGLCENNQFIPVKDGTDKLSIASSGSIPEVINTMSFGIYEAVICHFKKFKVKVLSSMGEQSTGKSYMMNHILGTSFDGDARRTTEGIWMSLAVVQEEESIYLGLDFEAISSSERTTQEDTFLSLFNACVSDLIIFKSMPSLNRSIIYMFERFQESARLISDETMFKSILAIVIRDTDTDTDQQKAYQEEYTSKLGDMVQKSKKENWITKLYSGSMKIYPWPQFRHPDFYEYMVEYLVEDLRSQQRYDNGIQFLHYMKVVMGKLMTKDWGTINNNLIPLRIELLRQRMKCAIENGLASLHPLEPLKNHESGIEIHQDNSDLVDFLNSFPLRPESKGNKASDIPADNILKLRNDDTTWDKILEPFRQLYENLIMPRDTAADDSKWIQGFNEFLRLLVERRKYVIKKWEDDNLISRFPKEKEDHRIREFQNQLEDELKTLKKLWTICGSGCSDCQLRCLLRQGHEQQHSCLTDHKCHHECTYKDFHNEQNPKLTTPPICQWNAGHSGMHVCNTSKHLCGKECRLYGRLNCQKVCAKTTNHLDSCQCQTSIHLCGVSCSLTGCGNRCTEPYEPEHDRHRCDNNKCPRTCKLCKENCSSDNHFHAMDTNDDHHCGREHNCPHSCEERGVCHVETEPQKQDMIYKNDHQSFTYTKHIQISRRLPCAIKIPAYESGHQGIHRHKASEPSFHYCDKQCPYCHYFCTFPIDHPQKLHSTSHGNMDMAYFVSGSDANQFEFEGRIVKPGDSTTFLMCTHFCSGKGRHRHINSCKSLFKCLTSSRTTNKDFKHIWGGHIRPNPEEPKDYVTHRRMWDLTGFQDPYVNSEEEAEFKLCDFECRGQEHKGKDKHGKKNPQQFCQLPMFHSPLSPDDPLPNGIGYISIDGHYFLCNNPLVAQYHVIFVTDRSSSMSNQDNRPQSYISSLMNVPNNRYGSVIMAVKDFIGERNSRSTDITRRFDRYSLILFNKETEVTHEYIPESESHSLISGMLNYSASSGTSFKRAIKEAEKIAVRNMDSKMHTVIIFLSDGEDNCPKEEIFSLCQQFQSNSCPLTLYTVLFNNGKHNEYGKAALNEMASIAAEYAPVTQLQSGYFRALNGVQLSEHFVGLASGMRKATRTFMAK